MCRENGLGVVVWHKINRHRKLLSYEGHVLRCLLKLSHMDEMERAKSTFKYHFKTVLLAVSVWNTRCHLQALEIYEHNHLLLRVSPFLFTLAPVFPPAHYTHHPPPPTPLCPCPCPHPVFIPPLKSPLSFQALSFLFHLSFFVLSHTSSHMITATYKEFPNT